MPDRAVSLVLIPCHYRSLMLLKRHVAYVRMCLPYASIRHENVTNTKHVRLSLLDAGLGHPSSQASILLGFHCRGRLLGCDGCYYVSAGARAVGPDLIRAAKLQNCSW